MILKRKNIFSRPQLMVFILIFAAIGGIIIWRSLAVNPNLPGDLNNDNTVNVTDLSILLSNYGTTNSTADINGDGAVNVLDMSILLSNYGKSVTSFSTNLTSGMTITPPFTWTFNPGVTTTAGYFYADGVQLAKITGPGPYSFTIQSPTLTAGSHILGGSWDLSDGSHVTFPQTYTVNVAGSGGGTVSCTRTLTSTDSIINAYNATGGGDVICLAPGTVYNVTEIDFHNSIGTSTAPVTITSADRTHPSTILGRIVTFPGANYITFSHLKLDGKCPLSNCVGPTIGSDHITLQHNDITNENTSICIHMISDATYGTAHYTLIDQNRIHNCGRLPYGSTNNDHGIYDIGYYNTITNNYIYNNSDRGIQLRGAHGDIVHNNVVDNNGEGIIFGELGASNNNVYNNIFSNSVVRYNIESYWGGTTPGTGNTVHDSCVWTTRTDSYAQNNSIQPGISGVTITNVKFTNPQYTNRAGFDFSLVPGSACTGYGVQAGISPGI